MATSNRETSPSNSEDKGPSTIKCPLCQAPIPSNDALRRHFLTSCSNYEQTASSSSNEEPRPKQTSCGEAPGGMASAPGPVTEPPRVEELKPPVNVPSDFALTAPPIKSKRDNTVMFMWQPLTEISFPSVTLLASFQRGSVELTRDFDSGHYASKYVDIAGGTYQGQLVVGSGGFIHPVRDFTVSKDDEVVILQFTLEPGGTEDLGFGMQSNPSYGIGGTSEAAGAVGGSSAALDSMADLTSRRHQAFGGSYNEATLAARTPSSAHLGARSSSTASSSGHYFGQGAIGGAGRGAKANSSASDVNHGVSEKLHIPRSYYVNDEEETFENYNNSYRNHPVLERAGANASRMEAGKGSLREQLEEVTRERDRLRNSQEQSEAAWKRQVKRLEEQLEMANMREGSERIHKNFGNVSKLGGSSELVELKDRNVALQEQVLEYEKTIQQQSKMMQTATAAGTDAQQLLNFSRKQQVEQAEYLEEMKRKMEDVLKMQEEYIQVFRTNVNLAGQLEDYQSQSKMLLQELEKKDTEIDRLKDMQGNQNEDRLLLELETMRQKCDGWKDEVERLLPLEEEAEQLRKDNVELSQQLAQMVEVGERSKLLGEEGAAGGNGDLLKQLAALQELRVQHEEEISHLREEKSSMLTENASLMEGSQPQNYASLQKRYKSLTDKLKLYEIANEELNEKLQIATDDSKLKPIQDKMDRYKKERDAARMELEAQLKGNGLLNVDFQEKLSSVEDEKSRLQERLAKCEVRMRTYREDRNVAREQVKELEMLLLEQQQQQKFQRHQYRHHHAHSAKASSYRNATELHDTKDIDNPDELDQEQHGQIFPREHQRSSPDQYSLTSEVRRKDEMSPTPSEDSLSPSLVASGAGPPVPGGVGGMLKGKRSSNSAHGPTGDQGGVVEVKTKEGPVMATIQRPSSPLNPKFKPQVVIKRSEGYEMGTLMYVGKLSSKDVAGVYSEIRQTRNTSSNGANACDGTYKDGKRYFKCPNGHGVYVPLSKVYQFAETDSATV